MPQVSRNELDPKTEKELSDSLTFIFSSIDQKQPMEDFLSALLTPTEKVMLAKRLAVVIYINEGLNDTEITDALHLTRMTVAKLRYYYEARGQGFKHALTALEKKKRLDLLKKGLLSVAGYSIRAAGGSVKVKDPISGRF